MNTILQLLILSEMVDGQVFEEDLTLLVLVDDRGAVQVAQVIADISK